MFRKKYKEDFDSITPNDEFMNNLTKKLTNSSPGNRPTIRKQLVAVAAIAAVVVCLLAAGSGITQHLNVPSFTLVAYADDNTCEKVSIDENAQVKLPFGKISRGEKHSYIDETEKTVYCYDSGFEHGNISVEGKNISSVTYNCEKGELYYHDSVMKKQMEKDGKIKVCEFTAPTAIVTYKDGEANSSFEKLWNEGYFDNIKKEYFKNKSTNLSDYRVQLGQTGEQMNKGLWSIEIYYEFENGYPFDQRGKEVTATYYEECGSRSLEASWSPWYALDIVSEYKPVDFADLPSDTIAVTVHFKDGKIETKYLNLSFDSFGNLIAEVTNK
ncbi:MAG: hypothetical protein PHO25_11145 [Syntrophomonadaceae bacterium]|nr:hypothetical protein [Syntrophomonadaceae bacterium]